MLILLLQTPFFQNYLTQKVLGVINDNTKERTSIKSIKINWLDLIEVEEIEVLDYENNLLFESDRIIFDFDLFDLISSKRINFDRLTLPNGKLNLAKYYKNDPINLVVFIESLKNLITSENVRKKKKKESGKIRIREVNVENFSFSYNNYLIDSINSNQLDLAHFTFYTPSIDINEFVLVSDTITLRINAFSGKEINSGFDINSMSSSFELSNRRILLDGLNLNLANSKITDKILLEYTGLADLGTFTDSVNFQINLVNSKIDPSDVAYFTEVPKEAVPLFVSAEIMGKVSNLSIKRMNLAITDKTSIKGGVDLIGLPNLAETFILLDIEKARIRPRDLEGIIMDLPEQLIKVGSMDLEGQFSGFVTDFVAKVKINTNRGELSSDLNLKLPNGWRNAKYSGRLKVTNFNAGAFLEKRELFQKINFEGKIKGQGLTIKNANFFTEAKLTNSGIYGYNYKSINAKGKFASEFFEGDLRISDPNIKLVSHGNIDLNVVPEKINIQANIEKIDFRELRLMDDSLSISTKIDFNLLGLNIDSLNSEAKIRELKVDYNNRTIRIDSIDFLTDNRGSSRNIKFDLPDLTGIVKGDFYYTQLLSDLKLVANEIASYYRVEDDQRDDFMKAGFKEYDLDFYVKYGDLSKYFNFLDQDIFLSKNGSIEGNYYQRENALFSVYAFSDSLNYNGIGFKDNSIGINISKDLGSRSIMANVNLNSETQYWGGVAPSSNLQLEAIWEDNKLDIFTNIEQEQTESKASVNAKLDFYDEKLLFKFLPSNIQFLGKRWFFSPENLIEYNGGNLLISQLNLIQSDQKILIAGQYSDILETFLKIDFEEFDLHIVNNFIPAQLGGFLNGSIQTSRSKVDDPYLFLSDISISQLMLSDYLVGDMSGISEWESSESRLSIDMSILRKSINTIDLDGYYYPENGLLDMALDFKEANLKLLAPIFQSSVSNLEGLANGRLAITGTLKEPSLNGFANFSSGKLTYDYLGVTCQFDGELNVTNESIDIVRMNLTDRDNNNAKVSGSIRHKNFKEISPDVLIATDKFLFLNTSALSKELYYGSAYASGDINISGLTSDLLIKAKIKSEKGTKLYFPLSQDTNIDQKEYISFVNFSDSTKRIDVQEIIKNSSQGVRLDFDLEITPDAYLELIFNLRTGDIIKGSGAGNLKLVLDTDGEFELFGDIRIVEGAYNFTYSIAGATLLSKEFNIDPGGTITWYGDPFKGILNLDAVYRQFAHLSDFNPSGGSADSEVVKSPRIPVLVVLSLDGEMLTPNIGFQIKLDDTQSSASIDDQVTISRINDNEQELKRQVFSLLILRKFSPQDYFSIQGGGLTSLSEFLTNQLSYYASQFNENLEVDLDLASIDANALNTLQLRLSYTFLDGRLRVSGGGGFSQNTSNLNDGSEDTGNTFVGDWAVQYLLTNDGRLRVKAFRQADQISTGGQQSETGVSIQLIKSFDDFKEFVPKAREKAIKKREVEKKGKS